MAEMSGPRSLENAKAWMLSKLEDRVHPLGLTDPDKTRDVIETLDGLDGATWAAAWTTQGDAYAETAAKAKVDGDAEAARDAWHQACGFYVPRRLPCPNHPDIVARQFLPALDRVETSGRFAPGRIASVGRSFGGRWATKPAHLFPARFCAAVNWGGGVQDMFQPEWIEKSRYPHSHLMQLAETRSRMLGAANDRDYIEGFRRLSLLDQGVLDPPCAPLLLINGKNDAQCPIRDIELLTEHGDPKSVRVFAGRGHMGFGPGTVETIIGWLNARLS